MEKISFNSFFWAAFRNRFLILFQSHALPGFENLNPDQKFSIMDFVRANYNVMRNEIKELDKLITELPFVETRSLYLIFSDLGFSKFRTRGGFSVMCSDAGRNWFYGFVF
jgi:hypothetical protein